MKRLGVPFWVLLAFVVLGSQVHLVGAKADQSDDLLRSISAANRDLNGLSSDIAKRIQESVRLKSELREISKAFDTQEFRLRELIASEIADQKRKTDAINYQIGNVEGAMQAVPVMHAKIAAVLPKLQNALGLEQSAEESRQILAGISQDRAKAARLIQAIEESKHAELGNLLGQGARGPKVEIRETKNADGTTVVFRVGNLIHCLSTGTQCGGKSSSLTEAATGAVPSATEAVKPLKESLSAASKQTVALKKSIERFHRAFESTRDDTSLDQSKATELQNLATELAKAAAANSRAQQLLQQQYEAVIKNFRG
jgi:hypothetical protein